MKIKEINDCKKPTSQRGYHGRYYNNLNQGEPIRKNDDDIFTDIDISNPDKWRYTSVKNNCRNSALGESDEKNNNNNLQIIL